MVTLQLQVPKYLKKILITKYGDNYVLKENSLLGMSICGTLIQKSYAIHRFRNGEFANYRKYRYKEMSETFIIKLSVKIAVRKGFEINEDKLHKIVRSIDKSIREELYSMAILNKQLYNIEYQTTLLNFLDEYDIIEEELSYDSLRKDFNRNYQKLNKNY